MMMLDPGEVSESDFTEKGGLTKGSSFEEAKAPSSRPKASASMIQSASLSVGRDSPHGRVGSSGVIDQLKDQALEKYCNNKFRGRGNSAPLPFFYRK